MNRRGVERAVIEAERFLHAARTLLATEVQTYDHETKKYGRGTWTSYEAPKEQGAVRRASMDLTRALAEMRKP